MIEQIVFVIMSIPTILMIIRYGGLMLGNSIEIPRRWVFFLVNEWYVAFPTIAYQAWFWSRPLFAQ